MLSLLHIPAVSKKPALSWICWSVLPILSQKGNSHREYHHKINVRAIETIKPSSPTPSNLTTFKLSLIDNQVAPIYVPFVFFYPAPGSRGSKLIGAADRLEILKSSLAKALTRFYPLAGRLSKSTDAESIPIVLCNDEGVPFSSATVDDDSSSSMSMAQFLSKPPEIDLLPQLLPFPADLISTPAGLESAPQIAFRATAFPCGGLALGVCMFHKIVDGSTLGSFMKLWSAIARSHGKIEEEAACGGAYAHNRAATLLLPARHDDTAIDTDALMVNREEGKIVTRRFVFDAEAVYALKAKAKGARVPNPSRTEAVAGFLWKSAVSATTAKALLPDGAKAAAGSVLSVATMAVNLRPRLSEPWPDYSVGNIYWTALSFYHYKQQSCHPWDETKTLQELVGELRGSAARIDKEFVNKLQGGDGRQEFLRNQETIWKTAFPTDAVDNGSRVLSFTISSLIGLRLYDVDFGWGNPLWVSMTPHTYAIKDMVALMESPAGYGVDAWLTLYQQDMTILEQQPEFLTYAKNNTPVIC